MLEYARQLTDDIERHARALAAGYEVERLYNLRVAMRRLRSMLKHSDSHRAALFRKAWGGFATVTNRARDWDVFLAAARELLNPAGAREFETLIRAPVRGSRKAVLELVRAAHWRSNLTEWRNWLQFSAGSEHSAFGGPVSTAPSRDKASRTLGFALETGGKRAWHKFRIAVKELRYVADAMRETEGPSADLDCLVDHCKALQTALGNWHDTVVQLELLDALPPAPVIETLRAAIAELQDARLAEIRVLCADGPSMFTE